MKKMNKFWTFSIWYRIQFSWLAKNYSRFNFDLSINISLFSHTYTLFLSIYRFYHAHTLGAIIYKIKRNGDTCNSVSSSHAHTYTETYCDFDANSAQFCVCVFFCSGYPIRHFVFQIIISVLIAIDSRLHFDYMSKKYRWFLL